MKSDYEAEKRRCDKLLKEKQEIQGLLEKRSLDMKILDNETTHLRQKLVALSGDSLSASLRNESIELRESSLRQKEARLEQESKIRDQRIAILEQEVEQLAKQLATAQKERTISLGEMQSAMEQKIAEVIRLKEELIHYKKTVDQKDQHIAALSGEISQHQVDVMSLESAFKLEIEALNRLVDAQKNVTRDERKKCDKLLNAVTELEKIRKTAEQSHSQMEEALTRSAADFQEKMEAKNKVIDELGKEVDDLRDQLAARSKDEYELQLQSYFPAASTASRMLRDRSSVGATEVSRMSEEIETLRSENEKLNTEIRKLITEAEERAPLFHGKVMEQKHTMEYLDEAMKQLASITAEKEEWDRERDALIQLNSQSGREKDRFRQENEDLSRQVQRLVHTNNELRGNSLRNQFSSHQSPNSYAHQSSANQVISQHLVTFDSIVELQQRNQQLLAALRSLSDEKDEEEKSSKLNSSTGRDDRLEEALRELENLKRERRHNMQKMDELLKQRDAIKLMLGTLAPSSANDSFNDSNASASNVSSLESQITYLSKRIEKLESENTKIREDADIRIKELNELLLSSRDEVAAAKIAQTAAVTLQTTAEQKAEEFRRALDDLKSEYDQLLARCEKFQAESRKNKSESRQKTDEIATLKGELRRSQASLLTMTQERDAAVLREKELLIQLEAIKRDNIRMSSFSETTKSLSAYIEKCQADGRRQSLSESIREKLEAENSQLKASLEVLQKQLDDVQEAEAIELRDTQAKLTATTESNAKLTKRLEMMSGRISMLEKQLANSKAEVRPDLSKKIAELEVQLKQKDEEQVKVNEANEATVQKMTADFAALREKNTRNVQTGGMLKNKMAELQAKVTQLEKTIEATTKASEETKKQRDEANIALETSRKVSEGLQKQNEDMGKINQDLLLKLQSRPAEHSRAPESAAQVGALRAQIESMTTTMTELKAEKDAALAAAAAAREESKNELKKLASKAQSKLQNQRQDIEKKQEEIDRKDEEIRQKDETIGRLIQETEACECLRLRSLISQYENKITRLEGDLQEASVQRTKKPAVTQSAGSEILPSQPVFCQPGPSTAPPLITPVPLRHPVLPTPQQQPVPKGPPTASIRPLPHARSSVAIPTQPTIATVLPTQATVGVVAPSTSSEQHVESAQVQEEQVPDEVDPQPEVPAQIPTPASPQLPSRSENPDPRPGLKRSHSTLEEGPDRSRLRTNESYEEASVTPQPAAAPDVIPVQEAAAPPHPDPEPDPQPEAEPVPEPDTNAVHGEERRSPNQESAMRGDDSGDQDVIILDSDDGGEEESSHSGAGDGEEEEAGAGSDEDSDSDSDYEDGMEGVQQEAVNEYAESGESADNAEEAVIGLEEGNQDAEADVQMEEAEVDVSAVGSDDPPAQVFAQPRERSAPPRPGFFIQSNPVQVPQSYEDLGDGIVPSTPTLFIPRRDGAESMNSPCVPQSSFQFSSAPNQAVAESALGIETAAPTVGEERGSSPPPESVVPEVSEVSEASVVDTGAQTPETINISSDMRGASPSQSQDETDIPERAEDVSSLTNTNSSDASQGAGNKDQQGEDSSEPTLVSTAPDGSTGSQGSERVTRQRRPIVWSPPQHPAPSSHSTSQPPSSAAFSFIPPDPDQQPQQASASSSNIAQLQESIRGRQLRVRGATQNRARRSMGWRGSRGARGRGASQ